MKQKVSLVLSGGGARGIAHIGVIEELEKQGYEICSIAGTSMGSVVGGVYALGKLETFKKWMLTLDKIKVFNLVDFTFNSQGLVKGDKVLNKMKEFISDGNIEDLRIPYAAIAVDLLNKREVVFTKGSIYDAIRASISIPSILTPVAKNNTLLVDGGVLNNIPVNHVKRIPNDLLIAVDVNADVPVLKLKSSKKELQEKQTIYQEKLHSFQKQLKKILPGNNDDELGYLDLVNRTISLMTYTIAQTSLEKYPPDILINISKQSAGTWDFFMAEELVEIGRLATKESLKRLKS
jgi:NTE family protein